MPALCAASNAEGCFACFEMDTMKQEKTYSEKLRDPRWQRKRLQIMNRDGFHCQHCGDSESTLNVHHTLYKRGLAPWEYDDTLLITLCEQCHEQVGLISNSLSELMVDPRWVNYFSNVIERNDPLEKVSL